MVVRADTGRVVIEGEDGRKTYLTPDRARELADQLNECAGLCDTVRAYARIWNAIESGDMAKIIEALKAPKA